MKQTNNAIKFLMAQYRAIYQSAYLKGLASAIIVTASLAAGQAQAATQNFNGATSGGTITISQDSDVLEITTAITSKDDIPFTVKISTSKQAVNKVEGVAASAKKATFEINGADTTLKVAATGAGGTGTAAAGSLTIGTLDVKKGNVTVEANGNKSATLAASQIKVGNGGEITANGATGATAASTIGDATTKYNLESGSTITLGSGGAMLGQDIVSTGGKIVLNSGSYHTPTTSAQKLDFDVTATSSITLPNSGDTLGTLNLASGSTIDIKAADTSAGGTANELKITANANNKGSIVVLQDGVSLKSSIDGQKNTGGIISVKGYNDPAGTNPSSNSELHLTAKTLGEFLKPTDTAKNVSGQLVLDANSTLKFTNDSSVDIAADETKADGTAINVKATNAGGTDPAGSVIVKGAATIDGKKITISKTMATGLDQNLNVTADELTLGSSSTHNTGALGVASLTAKNLKFADKDTFVLADNITLSNLADDATDASKKVAQKGTITGPVIISSTTTVDGGLYTSTGDITISGGTINVHNNKNADHSSLTADGGNWILDRDAQNGGITVSGTSTLLDLSKATVKYEDPAAGTLNNVALKAQSGGEIKLKGEDIATLLGDGSTSGAVFDIGSGSQLTAAGDLTLKDDALIKTTATSGTQKAEIVLANGATLAAEGTLELQKFDATNGLTLAGKDATLQAGTLKLTLEESAASGASAILKDGHYVVTAGLDTNAGKGVVVSGSNAKFDFGGLKKDANGKDTALSSGGSTDKAIVVSGATMNVNAGTWNLTGKLTLNGSSPSLTVGNADTVLTSADSTIAATLNASELVIEAGSATVEKTGTLSVSKIDAIGSAINVSGTMSLAGGTYNESGNTAYDKFGIKLADDAITVREGASLTLKGSGVEKALNAVTSGDKVTGFDINTGAFDSGGSLVSKAGSTVNITYFKDGTVFTKEALKQLSDGLFGTDKTKLAGSINLGKVVFDGLQSSGGTVSWTDAKDFGVNYLPHYKNDDLMSAQLINVSGDTVYGHWGSVLDTTKNSGDKVAFADNASLNKAKEIDGKKYFALGKDNAVLGLEIKSGGTLTLANGGIAGDVKIGEKATLVVDSKSGYTTELESISGGNNASVNLTSGITQVNKDIKVGSVDSTAESILNVTGNLTLTANDDKTVSEFKGIVNVSKDKNGKGGDVNLSGTTVFAGATTVAGNFTSKENVTFTGNATIEGTTKFTGKKATVEGGGFLKAKDIELGSTTTLYIGRETLKEGSGDNAKYESSTGYLEADRVDLNGGTLFIDPEYGKATSIAVIKRFGDKPTGSDPNKDPVDVGNINGKLIIGQNSALFAGADATVELMKTFIKRYQESTGTSLTKDNGSILYVSDKLTVDSNSRIILDAEAHQDAIKTELTKNGDGKYAAAYNGATTKTNADLFLGKGSVLVVGQDTLDEGSAIYFDKNDASILAEGGSKVVLDGDRFISSRDIIIFQDSGNDGVKILGEKGKNDIKVESINGIMGFTMEAGKTTSGGTLELLTDKIDSAYRGASTPMRDYLIGYASLTKNWQEYYGNTDKDAGTSIKPDVERDYFVDRAADKSIATADDKGNITVVDKKNYNASQFVAVKQADGKYQVFFKAYNEFLEKVIRDTNGLAADQAARMGVFGGSADAAMLVGNASYEAVAGRFGMGQQGMLMTYANNGQGGAMWVAPVYKSRETNGFKAQGLEYGTDTSITGLVLGADLTYEDGIRYGVMANIGEGDSSGEGAAKGVSSEYKYYSFGFYAGYNYKAFSMVGDLSYSVVDSDVDANTDAGMVNTSFNTTNLSVGVTGQVNLSYRGLDIVPHAGLRYSMIDMDDYDMNGNGKIGSVSVDKANVMSVPVGVTISKEYFSEEWSFQPSIDLNLTANFGDDKIDGNVKWSGISNADLNTSNEFMDDLTYGVIFGFGAQSERLSIGAGLGYQGSSNVDEFTLTGTARYTF